MRLPWLLPLALLAAGACAARAEDETAAALAARLRAEIAALRPGAVRRDVGWRTCLLQAFREARQQKKPVLIWAFRGDPDEGRC